MIKLRVKKELMQSIHTEAYFIEAIQLCRILSAIQYNKVIYAMLSQEEDFNTNLQLSLIIYQAAILYEGIKKFKTLTEMLKDFESYKKNLENIERISNEKNTFFEEVICDIRNKVAFHFDKQVIARALEEFVADCIREDEEIIFIEGKTDLTKDTRFLLADNLNLRYILGLIKGKELSYEEKFKILARELLELSKIFCEILEEIIPEMVEIFCEISEQE